MFKKDTQINTNCKKKKPSPRSNMNLREFPTKQAHKRLIFSVLFPTYQYSNVIDARLSLITKPTKSGIRAPVIGTGDNKF